MNTLREYVNEPTLILFLIFLAIEEINLFSWESELIKWRASVLEIVFPSVFYLRSPEELYFFAQPAYQNLYSYRLDISIINKQLEVSC